MVAATGVTLTWTNEPKVLRGQERRFKVTVRHPSHSQSVPFPEPAGMPNPRSRGRVWIGCGCSVSVSVGPGSLLKIGISPGSSFPRSWGPPGGAGPEVEGRSLCW